MYMKLQKKSQLIYSVRRQISGRQDTGHSLGETAPDNKETFGGDGNVLNPNRGGSFLSVYSC